MSILRFKYISKFKYYLHNDSRYYSILIAIYLVVSIIGMAHHEMWRDELESWLITRDSASISELYENLTYIGHPILWYLCLYLAAKVTHNPVIIQVVHLIIATGVVYVFLFFSPFNKLQKTLFCFGYFPLYEYGIISRNYSLGILFVFIFCALYSKQKRNYVLLGTSLALASQTNVYSLIISFVLALIILGEEILNTSKHKNLLFKRQFCLGMAIYLSGLFGASAQIMRAIGASNIKNKESAVDITVQPVANLTAVQDNYGLIAVFKDCWTFILDYEKVLTGIWRSYVPIPDSPSQYRWGSNLLVATQKFSLGTINLAWLAAIVLSLLLFLFFIAVFAKQKTVLFTYICGTVAIYIFGIVAKIPLLRHNGHLFILLIVCYWLFYDSQKYNRDRQIIPASKLIRFVRNKKTIALTVILFIQLYAGMDLYIRDIFQPFSNINNVVRFIKTNQLEDSLIVGDSASNTFPLSAWLNQKIYYPEIADFATYTVSTPKRAFPMLDIAKSEVIKQVQRLNAESSENLLLVADRQLQTEIESNIRLLATFEEQSLINEKFFVYSIE